jgi:hypothetical protein
MKRSPLTLSALMAFVMLFALAFAALTTTSDFWASVARTTTLVALGIGLLAAILCRGRARSFWTGFSLFGCGSLWIHGGEVPLKSLAISSANYSGPVPAVERPPLLTTWLLDYLFEHAPMGGVPRVGDRIEIQWGNPASYYPARVLERDGASVKIRYEGDPQGRWDEWAAPNRVRRARPTYYHAAGYSVLSLAAAGFGGLLALLITALGERRNEGEPASR